MDIAALANHIVDQVRPAAEVSSVPYAVT